MFLKNTAAIRGKLTPAICYLLVLHMQTVDGLFRMTNVKCESFNQSMMVIKECRLRAVSRNITKMYFRGELIHPAHQVNGTVVKKSTGGYKPFVLSFNVDGCEFYAKRNNRIAALVFLLLQEFTSLNHSCPYTGSQIVDGFYLRHELMKLPLPMGDYALLLTWSLNTKKTFDTNVYFEFADENSKKN